jgi:hypothetical protein
MRREGKKSNWKEGSETRSFDGERGRGRECLTKEEGMRGEEEGGERVGLEREEGREREDLEEKRRGKRRKRREK